MPQILKEDELISILNIESKPAFLLGAGCSISSGCMASQQLIFDFKKRIYCQENGLKYEDSWTFGDEVLKNRINKEITNPTNEPDYSYFFERCFRTRESRNSFVKRQFQSKSPSLGYLCFAEYLIEHSVHDVLTTNFDHLVRKSVVQLDGNYDVVDSSDGVIPFSPASNKLVISNLHGDYNYDFVQNTSAELTSLTENTFEGFEEVHCEVLVVIGYSGADDSIINALDSYLKSNPNVQLLWVVLGNESNVSDRVSKLLSYCPSSSVVCSSGFDGIFRKYYKTYGRPNPLIDGKVEREENEKLSFLKPTSFAGDIETNAFVCLEEPEVSCVSATDKIDETDDFGVVFGDTFFGFLDQAKYQNLTRTRLSDCHIPEKLEELLISKLIVLAAKARGLKFYGRHLFRESGAAPYESLKYTITKLSGRIVIALEPTFTYGREPTQNDFLSINSKLATIYSSQHEKMLKKLINDFFR
jgi:hypothetical protein